MASYNLTHDFTHTLIGTTRDFNKDNQTITLTLNSKASTSGAYSTTFVAQLQVLVPGPGRGYVTVRDAKFPRNGSDTAKWTGLPRGKYRLRYEKSTDGIRVTGSGTISN